jgi:hypothetical protein
VSHKQAKAARHQRLVLQGIQLTMEDGQTFNLDPRKVMINDRETGKPLFDIVMEEQPVEPAVEVVQNGDWTGVRPTTKHKES